ncbi:MAG: MerR family transcriptional regulator [Cyclobacteriaceae bacterium]|jgi:DNA-binding transcriptional MerR regulator|nr:MerR family transcriptional regulator [Flammeovirgaceae bacterium]MCZ8020280.1 MerR family transcriptional regulator [Cytophagales bacterium]MCZ8327125.1 MerR family transcriptional regulator [Cyclobacteriaceae bacterium]
MGKYSIKELEQLSGIKAHTIRIWEKRYTIIEPQRTQTNIRYYSDADLRRIISISLLNNHGVKISKIADLSEEELNKMVIELSEQRSDTAIHIDQLVISMIDMEEEQFEKILSNLILRYGFEKTITEIIYPFLEKIGILWQTQNISPAQEHFISNLIRQKIIVAIDGLPIPPKEANRIVLFLRENEMHELGLLFYHYVCRRAGYRTYYLGQNVPFEDLVKVAAVHNPSILLTSITSNTNSMSAETYLKKISAAFPTLRILASGYQVSELGDLGLENVTIFKNSLLLKDLI